MYGWTSGYEFESISKPSGPFELVSTDWGSLHFATSSRELVDWLRRKANSQNAQFEETNWLYHRLLTCLVDYRALEAKGALIFFRQPVAASLGDEEIEHYLGSKRKDSL